jgi:hypothetical protein
MAEALKEEGNKLMNENKPNEAISKYVRSWGLYLSPFNFFNHLAFPVLSANSASFRYTEAINVAGTSHLLLSNRSAAYAKAGKWKEALEDADSCLSLNEKFDKGKTALAVSSKDLADPHSTRPCQATRAKPALSWAWEITRKP